MSIAFSITPPAATGWRRACLLGLAALDVAAAWTIVALVTVMVTVVSAQVFMRYALNSSIGWADEVSRLMFVWSIFLAIPLGIRLGAHIGIEMLTARLPAAAQDVLARAVAAARRRADGARLLRGGGDHLGPVGRADGVGERERRPLHRRALHRLRRTRRSTSLWIVLAGKPKADPSAKLDLE